MAQQSPAIQQTDAIANDPIAENILAELEATRREFHDLARSIPPEKWRAPTDHPSWTVADILFHISMALRFLPGDVWLIRKIRRVPQFPGFLFHRWNDWYTRRGGRRSTPESVMQEYDAAHRRTLQALSTVRANEWKLGAVYPGWDPMLAGFVTLEDLFHYPARHFTAHAAQLKSALSDNPASGLDNRSP